MSTTPTVRHETILGELRRAGSVRIRELAVQLDVSPLTIRRDLTALADRGTLRKVHGGAVVARAQGFGARVVRPAAGPPGAAVARAAVGLLAPGDTVAVVGGAWVEDVACAILDDPRLRPLTVVTTSLPAALALSRAGERLLTTVLPGGEQSASGVLAGAVTEQTLAAFRVDTAIVESAGIGSDGRVTATSFAEAATFEVVLASAARTLVLAPRGRIGQPGLARWASLDQVDVVVIDGVVGPDDAALLDRGGVRVVVAP